MNGFEKADSIVMAVDNTRRAKGISIRQLSDMSGVTTGNIEKWLSGANKPSLYGMAALLDALGYELAVRRKS